MKVFALTYDDGNNYYGNVEVLTDDFQKVIDYILDRAAVGLVNIDTPSEERYCGDLDGVWINNPVTEIADHEQHIFDVTEYHNIDNACFLKYVGPRDDVDMMTTWLEEFTDHKFRLTATELEESK